MPTLDGVSTQFVGLVGLFGLGLPLLNYVKALKPLQFGMPSLFSVFAQLSSGLVLFVEIFYRHYVHLLPALGILMAIGIVALFAFFLLAYKNQRWKSKWIIGPVVFLYAGGMALITADLGHAAVDRSFLVYAGRVIRGPNQPGAFQISVSDASVVLQGQSNEVLATTITNARGAFRFLLTESEARSVWRVSVDGALRPQNRAFIDWPRDQSGSPQTTFGPSEPLEVWR